MKYDLKKIMLNAWKNYRKQDISFAEALHRAWLSAKAEEINAERNEQRGSRSDRGDKYMGRMEKARI